MSLLLAGRRPKPYLALGNGVWVQPSASVTEVRTAGDQSYVLQTQTLHWQTFVPNTYRPGLPHPVWIGMTGTDEEGTDNQAQLGVGMGPWINSHLSTFPAIAVLLQYPAATQGDGRRSWAYPLVEKAIEVTSASYAVDPKRIAITGLSLGGLNCWELMNRTPTRFCAAVVCAGWIPPFGGISYTTGVEYATNAEAAAVVAAQVPTLPIWHFQGELDQTVTLARGQVIRDAFQPVNPNYIYDERAGWDHQATCENPYTMSSVYTWLLAQRRA
jgi:predicted peptidase